MITRVFPHRREPFWHPTDEDLLCLVDDELSVREAERVREHLARCWRCRRRGERMEDTVGAFMDGYADWLQQDEAPIDVSRLPRRAMEVLWAAPPRVSVFARAESTLSSLRRLLLPSRMITVRLAAVCATALLVLLLSSNTGLSARQLVKQTDRVEQIALNAASQPVVYQRLEVARRQLPAGGAVAGTWDVWTDVGLRRHRSRPIYAISRRDPVWADGKAGSSAAGAGAGTGAGAGVGGGVDVGTDAPHAAASASAGDVAGVADLAAALLAALQQQGGSDAWPVSMRSHQRWRAHERPTRETITESRTAAGEPALTLDTRLDGVDGVDEVDGGDGADGGGSDGGDGVARGAGAGDGVARGVRGIVRATLVVRERDWHPVEQRLVVHEGGTTSEFIVREVGFRIVPFASLPVAFFDDGALPPPHDVAEAEPEEERIRPAGPTAADLVTAEVEAMYALHRLGVTAEDDISVERRPRGVDVNGLTTTEERRRQLTRALAAIPFVRPRIQTAEEALAALVNRPGAAAGAVPRFDESHIEADRIPVQALAASSSASSMSTPASAATSTSASVSPSASTPASTSTSASTLATGTGASTGVGIGPATAVAGDGAGGGSKATEHADAAAMRRARDAVKHSLTLLERAWALRRLAEWSRRTSAGDVTPGTHALIDRMLREHMDAASKALAALDTTVSPALAALPGLPASSALPEPSALPPSPGSPSSSAPSSSPATDASSAAGSSPGLRGDERAEASGAAAPSSAKADRTWAEIATDFFGVVAEIDRDTRRLFTASPPSTATPSGGSASAQADEEARRLRQGLDAAARCLDALQKAHP
jgi:hypothetical protein